MSTDVGPRALQFRRIAQTLRSLAEHAADPAHRSRLLTIAAELDGLADSVERDPPANQAEKNRG